MNGTNLIFEKGSPGRRAMELPDLDVPRKDILVPNEFLRQRLDLPELSELDVVRHFISLSRSNFGVDNGFYPLGSCTMKYNPKINEDIARFDGFANLHPYSALESNQGSLQLMHELECFLSEIMGMDRFTLQPAAGAHGELVGLMIMKAYFEDRGEKRTKILVPDSAHGTNPASSAIAGFEAVEVKSDQRGGIDIDNLKTVLGPDVAGLMLTNPNTLGLFDENILEIADLLHSNGSLFYCDGANANAVLGVARPGDMGFDMIQLNLHKTFSTPHGGGGPGSGPVGVKKHLADFLPKPVLEKDGEVYRLDHDRPKSIGRVKAFHGNFGVMVKAYSYIRALGPEGLRAVAENSVLNANYLMARLKGHFDLPFDRSCMHEFVLSDKGMPNDVTTNDLAKRLLDYGLHPSMVYFPLIVHGAIMIEPTETESKETLDEFADAMLKIREEAETCPEIVSNAPHNLPVTRLDAVKAAREPKLRWERK